MTDFSVLASIFRYLLEERKKHVRDNPDTYYVTDLLQCAYKRELSMKFPELSAYTSFEPAVVMGILVHEGLEKILSEMDIEVEVEGEKTIEDPEADRIYVVKGRADAIVTTDDGRVGIEIKTSRNANNIPYEHHIDQARLYNWLFDLKKTILVYITPTKLVEYEIVGPMDEKMILHIINSSTSPLYEWECKYCPFSKVCPKSKE